MANSKWFISTTPVKQVQLRLFCFPYAGGGASAFASWSSYLPAQVQLCAVQLPGRESRLEEPPFTQIQPLVQELSRAIVHYSDLPFAFFGHSLGAIVAFELARELRRQSEYLPLCLFASARHAPQLPNREACVYRVSDVELVERLRSYNGTPESILQDPVLLNWFLPVLRADLEVNETYVYTPDKPLDCPISAFRGSKDGVASYDEVAAWREQTRNHFNLRTLPGDHFFVQNARALFLEILTCDLRQLLNKSLN